MIEDDLNDAAQDGLLAAYTELLKDEQFRTLMGCLATVYGVTARKVSSIDQRSFKAAKDRIAAFLARTTGWNAKLSRDTRNGSWSRGAIHEDGRLEGRPDPGGTFSLGRRSGGLRSGSQEAADSPEGVPAKAVQGPQVKNRCPTCQSPAARVWRIPNRGLVCPACVRTKCAD